MSNQALLAELDREGNALYESTIKSIVEPQFEGQFVAIHVDSDDYAIGKSTAKATRALRKKQAINGRIYIRKIGDEPEYGLAFRLLGGVLLSEPCR